MRKKRRRSWKLSQGGASVFIFFLVAPLLAALARRWPTGNAPRWWYWPLFVVLLLFFSAVLWFISLRPLMRQRLWTIPRTWYEGLLAIGLLFILYAIVVFVTGYTPSRYNSHPVPRSTGFVYLYWAMGPLILGSLIYLYEKWKGSRVTR